ncbi:MAG: dynamin family protein [Gammaproteobacteria bacterium]|nr:dynamin family protein [Gammaproteobacteria bacterium]
MAKDQFTEQLEAYSRWKEDIICQIKTYREWLAKHEMSSPEDDLRMYEILDSLDSDHITIGFAAEFSRGKTELINSIFFADYKRRLLPSSAGRTTMCPTELFYDHKTEKSYIRMLPIETRLDDTSISEFKQDPNNWINTDLDVDSPDHMAEAFKEIIKTKSVPVQNAIKLGLYSQEEYDQCDVPPVSIEIPMWRHVMISFPHPLLKQGLVILDTPGLNAMGSEPELTMDMLPNAQAVIFVLAADTGATKTDMQIWRDHAQAFRENRESGGLIVVLNKIDTLWDELQDEATNNANIQKQVDKTAEMLNIDASNIYPVSAQKGLLARVKGNDELLEKSGLLALEATLSDDVLPAKQHLVRENIVSRIGSMVETTRGVLTERHEAVNQQLEELRSLSGKSADVLMETMQKLRTEQGIYQKDVENFQTSRHVLKRQLVALIEALGLDSLDKMIAKTRTEMVDSWTTHGLRSGMKGFFENARDTMTQVNYQAEKSNAIVQSIYDRFRDEHGFTDLNPTLFTTARYSRELDQLYKKAGEFRESSMTAMTEQSFVVKKFIVSMVSHARNIFFRANQDAEEWAGSVMRPLAARIKERKIQLEKRLSNLQKIKNSREKLSDNIAGLEKQSDELMEQLGTINKVLGHINTPLAPLQNTDQKTAEAS